MCFIYFHHFGPFCANSSIQVCPCQVNKQQLIFLTPFSLCTPHLTKSDRISMAQQECKVKVPVKGEEKNKENKMLTKLMKYLQENNSRKFVSELNKMLEKEDFERVLNSQINNTYLIVEAAKNNHLNIVTQLVQKQHVNVSYTDKDGKSALYWSCYNNNDKMCEYLMHHGADPNIAPPLITAAFKAI